jgi:DNA invertase Pin-like site-specific DNA recombinase
LVAKLDRLSREVEFIFHLRNSKVDFVCADIPELTTLTLGIFASFAQHERELISQRTKKALEEKKKQGVKLGNPQLLYDKDNIQFNKSLKVRKENAYNNENNKRAGAFIVNLRNSKTKWKNIVIQLNDNGFRTRRGGRFSMTQARLLYERYIS